MLVKYVIRVVYNSDVKIEENKLVINLSPEQLEILICLGFHL
nr:MAG TPA: hypothetical protein [Caudoviricetes sp.]